jgi:hypothetical protein
MSGPDGPAEKYSDIIRDLNSKTQRLESIRWLGRIRTSQTSLREETAMRFTRLSLILHVAAAGLLISGLQADPARSAGASAASHTISTTQPVSWTSVRNCTVTGSSLEKTSGTDNAEDAGAVSAQEVTSGPVAVQFRVAEISKFRFLGLSSSPTWTGATGMDYSWRLQSGSGEVYENNRWRHTGPIVGGDLLRIAVDAGVVRYYRNGSMVYTSTRVPAYPLRVHASIIDLHGTVKDATLTASVTAPTVTYGWVPPAQTVGGGASTWTVPAGYVHQTAWAAGGGPDVRGVYAYPTSGWRSMVWRWADTMRPNSIQSVTGPGGKPAYRVELTQDDDASPGTAGNSPRAEFFSVDPGEKRRQRTAPAEAVLRDGDQYWATFALYIPADFPVNHRWATLFQRKFQDTASVPSWFTLNVHRTTLDVSVPGNTRDRFIPVADLAQVRGRWVQFTVHEKLSSGTSAMAELFVNGQRKPIVTGQPTVPAGDINFHFQYGYYRSNDPANGQTEGPGTGVVYFTPMLIARGAAPEVVPALP